MGKKKLKLPFPFKSKETQVSSWPWPMCGNPKTISFRAANDIFKTMNSAYLDAANVDYSADGAPDLHCISPFESASFSSVSEVYGEDSVETVIRGLRSERLFFEPGETSSILEEAKLDDDFPFKESVAMAVDSTDPFVDFRRSMEEMVEAHGLKDWECLEELLSCYLRVNGKSNHGYIVGAFVDLLVSLAFAAPSDTPVSNEEDHPHPNCSSSSITTHSFTSPLSFSSITTSSTCSPSLSLVELVDEEMEKTATIDNASSSSSN